MQVNYNPFDHQQFDLRVDISRNRVVTSPKEDASTLVLGLNESLHVIKLAEPARRRPELMGLAPLGNSRLMP